MRKPEDTSFNSAKTLHDFFIDVVVYDILKINLIEVVSPGVEDREALVFDSLSAILLNIFFDECEVSFIGWNWVGKIILINCLLRVTDKGVNRFDARWRLKILILDLCVESSGQQIEPSDIKSFKDTEEHSFEAFHVPVLVDSSVDDVWSENLLGFVGQQENQIVEVVDRFKVVNVLLAVVWDKLLEDEVDGRCQVLTENLVLACIQAWEFDFVCDDAAHRHYKCGNEALLISRHRVFWKIKIIVETSDFKL